MPQARISSHTDAAIASEKDAAVQHDALEGATPSMRQYLELKQQYPDYLLFYRMGDFYELFFDDAHKAAAILDIALTKRGKHAGAEISMCGVPAHASDAYLERLIASGEKVAICEQLETPEDAKKRGHKAVIKRDVVRIVTPGTITEETLLDARAAAYLLALSKTGCDYALAWLELSTGEFLTSATTPERLPADLARISPAEILVSQNLYDAPEINTALQDWKSALSVQHTSVFEPARTERALKEQYRIFTLDSLGALTRAQTTACGALMEYVHNTQKGATPRLDIPRNVDASQQLLIDAATLRNLELTRSLTGDKKGCLLHVIDRTVTAAGARLLSARLRAPLAHAPAIAARLDAVEYAVTRADTRQQIRALLSLAPDVERALSRLFLGRGGPRDIANIRAGLQVADTLYTHLQTAPELPAELAEAHMKLTGFGNLAALLESALADENLPLLTRDGGFIRAGYNAPLDELRSLSKNSREHIAALQTDYIQETGIPTLKIKFNNVLGYFVEITATHQAKITPRFIHRQSLAGVLRYTTTELGELEQKLSDATGRALKLELQLFDMLVEHIRDAGENIAAMAHALAVLDVTTALAERAEEGNYTRPVIDNSTLFDVHAGRHPVVETMRQNNGESPFIGNDCVLDDASRHWLLTGPNMAGKSTFLRQNAVMIVLAQMGSFVPASSAYIGVVDRLFSRVGAADDLARGRSTFMVEMVETATILLQATERSFVILDEIGRGTATYDGMAIAWSVVEHLHHVARCRTLFATHYHELTHLTRTLPHLSCHSMQVKEWQGDIIFMHRVVAGAADRSYGIHVAQLAGLPAPVITRARQILSTLEAEAGERVAEKLTGDLPLFHFAENVAASLPPPPPYAKGLRGAQPQPSPARGEGVVAELSALNPDELSPKDALEILYRLKQLAEE